ncbi:iron-siderophore ABC transporter substrate-binding protein [Glaciihabitans sp. dw_435]|uniref:iron-siderophore ABC transporter substrate-binding protein n=1 Tax=Glaciihabitans sp. dw_435 TaxID=2720081 RepID=UPI001BD22E00|nr:iron-siderophore ABC transporter substrate-binding protein [Glaciihabitans sp. dw_435]
MKLSRLGLAAVAIAALALTACSSPSATPATDASASASASAAFPATVSTKFGDVTIDKAPERIVALGWGDAETALALGAQPVGASDWLGFGGEGVGPWAKGLYTTAPKIIETLEPSYEAIAALKPDLILDTKSSGDQARYDRLSSIAPTIGVPKDGDSYLTTPTEQMTMISTALGKKAEGETLLAAVEKEYADAKAAHPEWAGKTVAAATKTSEGWGAYIEGSDRVTFLEKLGFVQSPTIAALKPNASGFSVDISSEKLDLLDADLVVAFPIFIDETEITGDALWKAIPAVAAGHSVVISGDVSSAYSLGTTLATKYAIDTLVPLIDKAVG